MRPAISCSRILIRDDLARHSLIAARVADPTAADAGVAGTHAASLTVETSGRTRQ